MVCHRQSIRSLSTPTQPVLAGWFSEKVPQGRQRGQRYSLSCESCARWLDERQTGSGIPAGVLLRGT